MNWEEYIHLFENILSSKTKPSPYDEASYLNFTKLNITRIKRWLKKGIITPENELFLQKISIPLEWTLITEPWCGDASQISPFIFHLSQTNPNFQLKIQLRDGENSEISNYLTNGAKAIPKLIIRDSNKNDVLIWGPRTQKCHEYFLELKNSNLSVETQKAKLQEWYNQDSGFSFQDELIQMLAEKL